MPRRRPGCARRPRPSRLLPGHRIAIDARAAARPELGGVERWARELATRLPRLRPDRYEVLAPRPRLVHRAGHAWEQLVLPVRAAHAAALLCPANLAPLLHPRNVIVIHDAAALRHPEWYSPAYAAWQRRILPALARRALHVVTVSEFSRRELIELTGVESTVIPGGVDERFSPEADAERAKRKLGLHRPYVLCVASHTARKNLKALVPLTEHIEVVVAGGHRPQFAREEGLDHLRLLGHVPDELLPGLYAGAEAFVLPSLYEGFGLPVIEAMASGTPVVVADSGALRETVGGAGRVVPEAHVVDAVLEALGDDGSAGIERAKDFSWTKTAQAVDALLSARVAEPPPGTPRTTAP